MIITLTGPSAAGKTTLLTNLLRALPELTLIESVTTRAPRPTDEKNYRYVSDEEFQSMEQRGEFLWTANPHGARYGTTKEAVDAALAGSPAITILVIPAVQMLYTYATQALLPLYIHVEDEAELRRRFAERSDMTQAEIESRIAECNTWHDEALRSGVPFVYLDGGASREALLEEALAAIEERGTPAAR